jgi:rare lipoprotein A
MLQYGISKLGKLPQSRSALAMLAATLVLGGSISEASAKSRHHHGQRHHVHHRHHGHHVSNASPLDANASIPSAAPSLFESAVQAPVRALASVGRSFAGMASYYGNEAGSRTASGQRFNQGAMTAAHRTLPFGTKLRVTHGGRSVVVTINDRGPFIRGRVLDLSKGAASAIGLTSRGVGRVVAEVM